jgi:hypothetical protein
MRPRTTLLLTGAFITVTAFRFTAAEELIANGDFTALNEDKLPSSWQIVPTGQKVVIDDGQTPADGGQSLRVDIQTETRNYGQILQGTKRHKPDTAYILRGMVRGTAGRIGMLQIKLFKNRKEIKRIASGRSGTDWTELKVEFDSADADEIHVLCRFPQDKKVVGQTVWFAQLSLVPAGPPKLRGVEAVATFHSLGLTLKYEGDVKRSSVCSVRYRKKGQDPWRAGMDLIRDSESKEFRGSLLSLSPDTEYEAECRVILAKPTRQEMGPLRVQARTWPEDVVNGELRPLPPGLSKEPLVIREQGKPDAWLVYRPSQGNAAVIDAGWKSEQAILIENAAYVVVENLAVRGGSRHGINVVNSHHVRVRRCDISGWGDPGVRREGLPKGLYVAKNGRPINNHAGVRVGGGSSQVVVEDNFIHGPRGTANSWKYGHPMGPQGILLDRTGGNNVVRNNDIIGSELHWWNDAIESISNREVNGGPYRDTDICGNVLAFANDDGIELDGGQINVRFWNNWIDQVLCGVSCAPNRKGPSYVFRNLIAGLGEERGAAGSAFKMGGGARWSTGVSLILHNTIFGIGGGLRSVGFGYDKDRGGYVAFSRNNLFAGPGRADVTNISKDPRNDFDYDLTSRGGVGLATGGEKHAVVEVPKFADAGGKDFRLAEGSSGIDQGCILPGVNDDFTGKAPDMGALESGQATPADFPLRPHGISTLPKHLLLERRPGANEANGKLILSIPLTAGKQWMAIPNGSWLQCDPPAGKNTGEPQTVNLTIGGKDLETRRHRGAVTFRTDAGYNRTVMVDAKVYHPRSFTTAMEAEAGKAQGGMVKVEDAAASGGACLHSLEGSPAGSVEFNFDVPEEGIYFVSARCLVPAEDSGRHDSFIFSMDGEEKRIWDIMGGGAGRWHWSLVNSRDGESPHRFQLTKGRHKLTITSREKLARLDRLVITNSPYAEAAK